MVRDHDKSLIIAEHEPVISLMMEELASDLGWKVEGIAFSQAEALRLLERCQPSVALLDIDLGSEGILGFASTCQERGIPVVFVTGYGDAAIPELCADAPVLTKPFSPEQLQAALQQGLANAPVTMNRCSASGHR